MEISRKESHLNEEISCLTSLSMWLHSKNLQNPYIVFHWESKENKHTKKHADLKMNNHTHRFLFIYWDTVSYINNGN